MSIESTEPFCCYIPEDQQQAVRDGQPFTGCTATPVWNLFLSAVSPDPYEQTQVCEIHVGPMLGGLPLWDIEPIRAERLVHDSDCSLHNAPAMTPEPCDCSQNRAQRLSASQ